MLPTTLFSTLSSTLFSALLTKQSTKQSIQRHHIALTILLLAPTAAALAETTRTTQIITTGTHIEQRSTYPAAAYDHCHFDAAHGHQHCYTDQFDHVCDQVRVVEQRMVPQRIVQQPTSITHSTRHYSAPVTIIERSYYNPAPVIFGYSNFNSFGSNRHFRQSPGLVIQYNSGSRHDRHHVQDRSWRRDRGHNRYRDKSQHREQRNGRHGNN